MTLIVLMAIIAGYARWAISMGQKPGTEWTFVELVFMIPAFIVSVVLLIVMFFWDVLSLIANAVFS
ncbi:hypothetical protein [uncultured Roseobacter sp.]|uniref:hypothetical protein n=1 Tax=uncultured Roseobacter sp. TaxID=114847 RepID=UPI00260F349C|nr:hypothetical protein [uncultured Roseobacter sp.]